TAALVLDAAGARARLTRRRSAAGDSGAESGRVTARDAGAVIARGGGILALDREHRLDARRQREDEPVGARPRAARAETRSTPAVGVAGAGPEAVLRGVRLAHLRSRHRDHLIGARNALAVVDERLARDPRGWRACRRRALRGPGIADEGENVPVGPSWRSGRLRRHSHHALARLLVVLLQLDRQGGRCGRTREPVARRREAERGRVTL